jgi:hypothetical protein
MPHSGEALGKITALENAGTPSASGPVFRAYRSTNLALGAGGTIVFNSEDFDPSSLYDTTNGRFTPTTAGYYYVHASAAFTALYNNSLKINVSASAKAEGVVVSAGAWLTEVGGLVYLNGSTDYVTITLTAAATVAGSTVASNFEAFRVA